MPSRSFRPLRPGSALSCEDVKQEFEVEDYNRHEARDPLQRSRATLAADEWLRAAQAMNCRWAQGRELAPTEVSRDLPPPKLRHRMAIAFNTAINEGFAALEEGECQLATNAFDDAGEFYAQLVAADFNPTVLDLWESRYRDLRKAIDRDCIVDYEFNG